MPTYAIGDIQGCFVELQTLLEQIKFSPENDVLWLAGDLINRGPDSLRVLRFIMELPQVVSVLGNHEFHFLALAQGLFPDFEKHTIQPLLDAPDRDAFVHWIRARPLLHHDPVLNFTLTHAGVLPEWTLSEARQHADEVSRVLLDDARYLELLNNLYGNMPNRWSNSLSSWDRLRFIINVFTRMRYIDSSGALDFKHAGPMGSQPAGLTPWFEVPDRMMAGEPIVFGHWASLRGITNQPYVHALDGGCVWGNTLIAMRLDDGQRFSVRSNSTKA